MTPVALMTGSMPGGREGVEALPGVGGQLAPRRDRSRRPATVDRSSSTTSRTTAGQGVTVDAVDDRAQHLEHGLDAGRARAIGRSRRHRSSVAGTRGSRTHHATPSAASPVLKTGGPTGARPLPGAMVAIGGAAALSSGDDHPRRRARACASPTLTDCGGCAAKLGADLLADALAGLGAEAAPEPT